MRFLFGFAGKAVFRLGILVLGFGFLAAGMDLMIEGDFQSAISASLSASWQLIVRLPQFLLQGLWWVLSHLLDWIVMGAKWLGSALIPDSPMSGIKAVGGFIWDAIIWMKDWVFPIECLK